jgi:hypothetical protein
MMKRILIATCLVFSLYACSKEDNVNDIPPGIRALTDSTKICECLPYINKYEWKEKNVYVLLVSAPFCSVIPLFYNEDGTRVVFPANYTADNFWQEAKLIKKVWSCQPDSQK